MRDSYCTLFTIVLEIGITRPMGLSPGESQRCGVIIMHGRFASTCSESLPIRDLFISGPWSLEADLRA